MSSSTYLCTTGASSFGVSVPAAAQLSNGIAHSPGYSPLQGAPGGTFNPWVGGIQRPVGPGPSLAAPGAGLSAIDTAVSTATTTTAVVWKTATGSAGLGTFLGITLQEAGVSKKYFIPVIGTLGDAPPPGTVVGTFPGTGAVPGPAPGGVSAGIRF